MIYKLMSLSYFITLKWKTLIGLSAYRVAEWNIDEVVL